jgi:nicotinamide mononucleotide adenylyltransferase
MMSLGCVTGRFQPVHGQHLALFDAALADCGHVVIAVTNPDSGARRQEPASAHRHTPGANPFTYFERVLLLQAALDQWGHAGETTVVPFDLTRPELWPEYVPVTARQFVRAYGDWEREKARRLALGGYAVTLLEGDPARRLSSTDIRARMQSGGEWEGLVPAATVQLLRRLLDDIPIRDRG